MQQIGEQLRAARLAKGMELDEIQRETKIGRAYLQALETGAFECLPQGDAYVKGFIRSYARVVGLEPRNVLDAFEQKRVSQAVEVEDDTPQHGGFFRRSIKPSKS